jgi:type VI secretion system Hcp family effector
MEVCMKKRLCLSVLITLIILGFMAAICSAADISKSAVCHVTIDGTKQGKFKGESMVAKQASRIDAYRYAFAITAGGGAATTKLQQGIVVITKMVAGASPQLFSAMTANEVLKTVTIELVQGSQIYQTVRLLNARVTAIRQFTEGSSVYEDVSFSYQKIEMTNHIANTSAAN